MKQFKKPNEKLNQTHSESNNTKDIAWFVQTWSIKHKDICPIEKVHSILHNLGFSNLTAPSSSQNINKCSLDAWSHAVRYCHPWSFD